MILVLLACSGGDPELAAEKAAVLAFREGRDALESDPQAALTAFRRAREARPDEPLLQAWEAMALARTGDLEGALTVVDAVLTARPDFAEARYDKAAWLARSGDPDAAGPELARALQQGAARPRDAMRDPDFAPHLQHPAFAFLPPDMLTVAVESPRGTVFWGSEVRVRLRILGTSGEDVALTADVARGPLRLIGVEEDEHESSEGLSRDVRYTFKVEGPGETVLGPIRVAAGPWTATTGEIRFVAEAPEGRESVMRDLDLRTPSEIRAGWGCTPPCVEPLVAPELRVDGTVVDVLTAGDARIQPPPPPDTVRYAFSHAGEPLWTVWRYPHRPDGALRVRRGRDEVLELVLP